MKSESLDWLKATGRKRSSEMKEINSINWVHRSTGQGQKKKRQEKREKEGGA